MSDEAEAAPYAPPDYGDEPNRCPVRFNGERCRFPDNHEKHSLEGGWHWWSNRPHNANEEINRLRATLAEREAQLAGAGQRLLAVSKQYDEAHAGLRTATEGWTDALAALREREAEIERLSKCDSWGWRNEAEYAQRQLAEARAALAKIEAALRK